MPPFWCAARLMPRREALAVHCLALAGFNIYLPRLRERRVVRGRRVEVSPPLFPAYCFVLIALQWHAARWCPGTRVPKKIPLYEVLDFWGTCAFQADKCNIEKTSPGLFGRALYTTFNCIDFIWSGY
jgi:hypothetical protein